MEPTNKISKAPLKGVILIFALTLALFAFPISAVPAETGMITGTVTKQGVALPGAGLLFVIQGTTFAGAITDAEGNYTQTVPANIEIDLRVFTPDDASIIGREFVTVAQNQTITLNFDFVPGTVVTGTVTQNGIALPGAHALGVSFGIGVTSNTDAQGQYSHTFQAGVDIDVRVFSPDSTSCIGRVLQLAPTPDVISTNFDFKPATVTGTVRLGPNPVPFAGVMQVPFGFGCSKIADDQGVYTHLVPSGAPDLL